MNRGADVTKGRSGMRAANTDWLRALLRTAAITPASTRTLPDVVDENAVLHADRPALLGEADALTHGELGALSNRVSRWALGQGLHPGDRVALMMANTPAYTALWIGLTRVGAVVALVNIDVVGAGLLHCLTQAAPRCVIVGADLPGADRLAVIEDAGLPIVVYGGDAEPHRHAPHARLDRALESLSGAPLASGERPHLTLKDEALLVYTSGTTGLPKAAHVSHLRVMMWSQWFAGIMDARPEDRLYDCLPMYHSIGGVAAVGSMLAAGGCVIVRRGFSASRFWDDVAASGATIFQYIGELCRFRVAAPPGAADRAPRSRLCCGNGLRGDVWPTFEARFAIPRIIEFYGATEGSFSLFNLEGKVGAIGRVPSFMAHRSPIALVRFDALTERPARGEDGFCVRCGTDEAGEALGEIAAGIDRRFEGYTDADASREKILRDVFAPGDAWFRTGDLMRRDAAGFYFFVDRVGDTFRWRAENVSCAAVTEAIARCPGVAGASVYGVAVPGVEGRAGMAVVVAAEGFDLATLRAHLAATLPRHARPLFLRVAGAVAMTGTFKPRKTDLVAEGFDPARVADPLHFDDGTRYVPLDAALHAAIVSGAVRL